MRSGSTALLALALLAESPAWGGRAGAVPPAALTPGPRLEPGDDPRRSEAKPPRTTAAAVEQEPADFNHPPRAYLPHRLHGWEVLLETQLADEEPERSRAALDRLGKNLGEIAGRVPPAALPDLRRIKVFLLHGPRARGGGRDSGLEYFRPGSPAHHDWLDERMESSIVIFDAANYLLISDLWSLKSLMHEFGHAWHLEHWPEDRPDIFDAWQASRKAGRYQTLRPEDQGTHAPNYAAQNHLEYFAELTATYFVGNTYFPRDRATLSTYDPDGLALVERLWGIAEGPR